MKDSKPLDVKQLIDQLGGFGRYQIWVFILACYACAMPALLVVNLSFVGYESSHRCHVPACDSLNATYKEEFLNFTTPYDHTNDRWERCSMYKSSPDGGGAENSCNEDNFDMNEKINCSEYVYDTSLFSSSIVTEFDLVCGWSWLLPTASSGYMVGMLLGAFLLGDLADRIGRKKCLVIAATIFFVSGVVGALANTYTTFLASRIVNGAGGIAIYQIGFILALEFVSTDWRTFVGIIIGIPFAIGEAMVALFAYYIREWQWLQAACILPTLIVLSYWWIMPESIRWLVSKGKGKEAKTIIKRIERINKITVSEDVYDALDPVEEINISVIDAPPSKQNAADDDLTEEKRNVLDLLRYPNTRKRTLNMAFCWIVVTLSYYGLSENSANLGGDTFVNFVAVMLIEIPSYIFAYLVLDKMGRKGTLCFVMLFGGITSILSGITPEDMNWLVITFSMAGKFGISAGFSVIYLYTAEIYPTSHRSVGLGSCSMSARFGGILAPFVASLGKIYRPLPLFIFGVLAIISGLLTFLLPETFGSELPQTLEKSENFGTDQSVFYFTCWTQKQKIDITQKDKSKKLAA